jgi:aarF domain-containing kinase
MNRFASAILLRPFQVNKNKRAKAEEKPKTEYEQQVELKQRLKSMLENEQLIPRVRPDTKAKLIIGIDLLD